MVGRLEGKVAVITGGTSGIGEATVRRFVDEGARVVLSGRSVDAGERIAGELGEAAQFVEADVTSEAGVRLPITVAVDRFGRLDCLFNNAGGSTPGGIEDVTPEQFHHAMDLLLGSVLFGIKHAAPIMKEQRSGRIISNSSINGIRASGDLLYGTAKAAVTHLTRIAGLQLAPYGITVNAVSPGAVATPIFYGGSGVARGRTPEHNAATMRKLEGNLAMSTPLGRAGMPEDIANAVLYLASDEGAYVNAHDLVLDGGMVARASW